MALKLFDKITSPFLSWQTNTSIAGFWQPIQTPYDMAANLPKWPGLVEKTVTWLQNLGWNIYEAQQRAEQKTQTLQSLEEVKQDLVSKWVSPDRIDNIVSIIQKKAPDIIQSPWVMDRIAVALGNRLATSWESYATDKTALEKWLSAVKDVTMLPFDVVWAVAQPVIEPIVKPIMETAPVKAGLQAYGEFRQANPRLAQNIEAGIGIWTTVAPFTKTGQAVMKAPGQLVKKWAEATIEWVKKVAPNVVKWVEATVDMATSPFKSIYNTAKQYVWTPDEIAWIQSAIKPKQKVKNGVVQRSQKQIDNEIQLTNGIIRNKWVKPTDLETYATAQKDILKEIGGEIERLTWQPLDIDVTPSSSKLRQLANSKEVQLLDPTEAQKLIRMADDLDANPRISLADAEAMNQYINDVLRSTTSTASEAYKRWLQILVQDLRDWLDSAISNIPWEFKDLKRAYGAVRNVYGDTIARQIVFNRQNMGGLIDSFGAIEWFGNIVWWAGKIVTGKVWEGFVDIGKWVTQNAVGRFIKSKNNPNNIIKAIFENWGKKSTIPDIKTKPIPLLPARATPRTISLWKSQEEIIAESKKGLSPNVKRPNGNNTIKPLTTDQKLI